jgi:amino acid transporter
MMDIDSDVVAPPRHGLNVGRLSQSEIIGQSLASIAPTATPAMSVPIILTISGNGSWLACFLAMLAVACIAHEINAFAKRSSSAGSLYSFVQDGLGTLPSLVTGWALLIAYVGTAAAVTGGFTSYAYSLLGARLAVTPLHTCVMTTAAVVAAGCLAYRDVQISTRLMLVIEAISILLIVLLFILPGPRTALHWDPNQIKLVGVTARQVRAGLVLAIFGFVGFESAASLGTEAVSPLKTIPRAIYLTAWVSGIFFMISSYAENIGFAGHESALAASTAPLQYLAQLRGLPLFSPVLAATTVCSFFACTLACINAAARTLFRMSHDGHLRTSYGVAHPRNKTPHIAIVTVSVVVLIIPIALTLRHVVPFDVYGWLGTFATYGFIAAYGLVALGSARMAVRRRHISLLSAVCLAGVCMVLSLAVWSAFDPAAEGVYRWLPYIFISMMILAIPISLIRKRMAREKLVRV